MGEGESSRERELRYQLDLAQAITHIGSWEWTVPTGAVTWSDELYRIYGYEPQSVEVTLELFLSRIAPEERDRIQREIQHVLQHPGRFAYREVILRPDGTRRTLDTVGNAIVEDGVVARLVGTCRDVTEVVARDEQVRFYADVFEHAQIGMSSWKLDATHTPCLVAFNGAMEHLLRESLGSKLGKHMADVMPMLAAKIEAGERGKLPPFRRTGVQGSPFLAVTTFDLPNGHLGISVEDVTERVFTDALHAVEQRVLEMIASGSPLDEILTMIAGSIEDTAAGTLGSVLLLDNAGMRIKRAFGPSLPEEYNRALEGLSIGPKAGSCGTAMYRRQPVIVPDIAHDPLWEDYKELVLKHGLLSCWSCPIIGSDGRVLGSFALYHRESRRPSTRGIEIMQRAAHVTAMAIERRGLDEELRALAARIEAAREDERTEIARDIHDQLGQSLTALRLDVGWLQRRLEDESIRRKLEDMALTIDDVLRTVRRISAELRPGILDTLGLPAAIEWQAEEFARRSGTKVRVTSMVTDLQLDRELSTNVFRIFQEALTNISRHAAASSVEVAMRLDRGRLVLEISDDGIGMPEIAPRGSSLGILGMRERAVRLGGDCTVRRRQPRGTQVTVTVPLRFPAEQLG
ncbi:MAG TPA: GAF domain-containing protein [Kofleriaceae bacterium]|nr:GAF domain-containing protein [Kofleriaceae bacterium]